jgi:hypothetical protein
MTLTFICADCRDRRHTDCPGSTRCDCQHRTTTRRRR